MYVEPAVAAPGGPLRVHVRLDARVAEDDLVVTIGGAVRPSFRLIDRRPAAVVDGVVDGAAGPAAADASAAASPTDCALISVLAPVLHARGPWAVQIHAHGASSESTPAAELRLRLPRRPESAGARADARDAARAAAHAAAHAEAPGSAHRCRSVHERDASLFGVGEFAIGARHAPPLTPHAAAAAITESGATQRAAGSLSATGRQMLAAGYPPPLLLRSTKQNHLAQAAALYTRERQEQTLDPVHVPTAAGPEEFHMMLLKLRNLLLGPMRKMVGPPPSTRETAAAFRWADTDADGSLSVSEFLAAQVVSRELNEQWEGRQAAEGKLLVEQRRARHTVTSRGKAVTKAELALEQQLALEEQQPSRWPAEQGRPHGRPSLLLPPSSPSKCTFGSASHSTPTFSFNPVLRSPSQ